MIAELKDCFRALNPNALRQMDIMQEGLENWKQKALAEEELTIYMQMEIAMGHHNNRSNAPRQPFQSLIDLKKAMREVKKIDEGGSSRSTRTLQSMRAPASQPPRC